MGVLCVCRWGLVHLHPAGGAESDRSLSRVTLQPSQGGHGRLKLGFVAEAAAMSACRGSHSHAHGDAV